MCKQGSTKYDYCNPPQYQTQPYSGYSRHSFPLSIIYFSPCLWFGAQHYGLGTQEQKARVVFPRCHEPSPRLTPKSFTKSYLHATSLQNATGFRSFFIYIRVCMYSSTLERKIDRCNRLTGAQARLPMVISEPWCLAWRRKRWWRESPPATFAHDNTHWQWPRKSSEYPLH